MSVCISPTTSVLKQAMSIGILRSSWLQETRKMPRLRQQTCFVARPFPLERQSPDPSRSHQHTMPLTSDFEQRNTHSQSVRLDNTKVTILVTPRILQLAGKQQQISLVTVTIGSTIRGPYQTMRSPNGLSVSIEPCTRCSRVYKLTTRQVPKHASPRRMVTPKVAGRDPQQDLLIFTKLFVVLEELDVDEDWYR